MKRTLIIIIATALVIFVASSCSKPARYLIKNDSSAYRTDFYTKNGDGCITFTETGCGCGGNEPSQAVTMCGDYTIVENPNWRTNE